MQEYIDFAAHKKDNVIFNQIDSKAMEKRNYKSNHSVYELETRMDGQMTFQKIAPCLDGNPQKPEVLFLVADENQTGTAEVFASISIQEAKEMVKGLNAIIEEIEG